MVTNTWTPDAEYMVWAKLHSGARFNLATSGVANLSLGELPARLEDLELTAAGAYGRAAEDGGLPGAGTSSMRTMRGLPGGSSRKRRYTRRRS